MFGSRSRPGPHRAIYPNGMPLSVAVMGGVATVFSPKKSQISWESGQKSLVGDKIWSELGSRAARPRPEFANQAATSSACAGSREGAAEPSSRARQQAKLLESMPGMGHYSAVAIASRIGDIRRFRRPGSLANYFGLTPGCRNSGEATKRLGSITKRGSKLVR